MKEYNLKEIKKLWRQYKLPTFTYHATHAIDDTLDQQTTLDPGVVISGEMKAFYRIDENMSFPEYLEYLEDLETERKINKLKE